MIHLLRKAHVVRYHGNKFYGTNHLRFSIFLLINKCCFFLFKIVPMRFFDYETIGIDNKNLLLSWLEFEILSIIDFQGHPSWKRQKGIVSASFYSDDIANIILKSRQIKMKPLIEDQCVSYPLEDYTYDDVSDKGVNWVTQGCCFVIFTLRFNVDHPMLHCKKW